MKLFKRRKKATGASSTHTVTVEVPGGFKADRFEVTVEGGGGPGKETQAA